MSKKIKVIPIDTELFTGQREINPTGSTFDIIAPVSWGLSTQTNSNTTLGHLGNTVVKHLPIPDRTYEFSWTGSRNEIRAVYNAFFKTTRKQFLIANLTEQEVVTPSILLDSKAMLASFMDHQKVPGAEYRDYLTNFLVDYPNLYVPNTYNVGSQGVSFTDDVWGLTSGQEFNFLQEGGIESFIWVPQGVEYRLNLNTTISVSNGGRDTTLNVLGFSLLEYPINLDSSSRYDVVENPVILNTTMDYSTIQQASYDRIIKIRMTIPSAYRHLTSGTALRGVINYSPLMISNRNQNGGLPLDYEDVPSAIEPIDDFVYNILSPNMAEITINFREVNNAQRY